MIELFVIADPSYPVDLERICQQINKLQCRLRANFVAEKVPPAMRESEAVAPAHTAAFATWPLREISVPATWTRLAEKPFYRAGQSYVLLTNEALEENYFARSRASLEIVSTLSWEYLTDVSLELGAAFFVTRQFYRLLRRGHQYHSDTRGRPFDFKTYKPHIDLGLKIGRLCGECQNLFDSDPSVDKEDLRAISSVFDHIVDCWRQGRSFCEQEPTSDEAQSHGVGTSPFIPTMASGFFSNDLGKIRVLEETYLALEASRLDDHSQEKGKALERFARCLIDCLSGFAFCGQDLRLQDCELDLSYRVDPLLSGLHQLLGPMVLIECKNRRDAASVQDISHHIVRLAHRQLRGGIFVSVGGISGYSPAPSTLRDSLALIVEEYRQNARFVLPVVWEDIIAVRRGLDLFTMLNNKINEIILQ